MTSNNKEYQLNNGLTIPNIGLGTWHIKDQNIIVHQNIKTKNLLEIQSRSTTLIELPYL